MIVPPRRNTSAVFHNGHILRFFTYISFFFTHAIDLRIRLCYNKDTITRIRVSEKR